MKKISILLLCTLVCCICIAQEQHMDSCQNEKYDFKRFDNECCQLIERPDKWRVAIGHLKYREYPPDSSFYCIKKRFYENGNIKEKGKLIPPTLKIGVWEYYDEQGCLIITVDENARFGKVKPEDVLNFAKKNQRFADTDVYYNVIVKYEDGSLDEIKSGSTMVYQTEENMWILRLFGYPGRTVYKIDGDTGKVLTLTVDYFDGKGKSNTKAPSLNVFDE